MNNVIINFIQTQSKQMSINNFFFFWARGGGGDKYQRSISLKPKKTAKGREKPWARSKVSIEKKKQQLDATKKKRKEDSNNWPCTARGRIESHSSSAHNQGRPFSWHMTMEIGRPWKRQGLLKIKEVQLRNKVR